MEEKLQQIQKEKQELAIKLQQLEQERIQIATRLVELQGIEKFLKENQKEQEEQRGKK